MSGKVKAVIISVIWLVIGVVNVFGQTITGVGFLAALIATIVIVRTRPI